MSPQLEMPFTPLSGPMFRLACQAPKAQPLLINVTATSFSPSSPSTQPHSTSLYTLHITVNFQFAKSSTLIPFLSSALSDRSAFKSAATFTAKGPSRARFLRAHSNKAPRLRFKQLEIFISFSNDVCQRRQVT